MALSMLFVLMASLQLTTGQNNSSLEVSDGNKKINVNATEYGTKSCQHGFMGGFPANLSSGPDVSGPTDFQVTEFKANVTVQDANYLASGLKFTWKMPDTDSQDLKGFYLKLQPVGSGVVICRLFDLRVTMTTSPNVLQSQDLTFVYTLFPFAPANTFMVDLFSLPTQREHNRNDSQVISVMEPELQE